MSPPKLTAWTFSYHGADGKILYGITVETPTASGPDHAEQCARYHLNKLPAILKKWDGAPGSLQRQVSATRHRREREVAIRAALNEMHRGRARPSQ